MSSMALKPDDHPDDSKASSALVSRDEADTLCVLLVDDEVAICQEVGDYLKRLGIRTFACDCVATALDLLREGLDPDCILVDIMMPDNDGFVLIDHARHHAAEAGRVPAGVVAMTGGADHELVRRLFRRGVDDFLLKPVSMPDVRNAVLRSCGLTRLRRRFAADYLAGDDRGEGYPRTACDAWMLLYGLVPDQNIDDILSCVSEDRFLPPLVI